MSSSAFKPQPFGKSEPSQYPATRNSPRISKTEANKARILVAIDFGTTYSAIAWVRTTSKGKPQTRRIIQSWPSQANTENKVPTLLSSDLTRWGFRVKPTEQRYEWFKLEQDPKYTKNELLWNYPKTTIIPKSDEEVEELITTFLRSLKQHAIDKIKKSFGNSEALFRDSVWEYIITVPAMWPEPAQNITKRCATKAGMALTRPLRIITEPEAAGIFALDSMCREWDVAEGDTFVICDAGGGTVDLISYTISQLKPSPILDEAVPGVGKLCGSTFLDRRFDTWLTNKFLGYHEWTNDYHADAMHRWESEIKRNFSGDPEDTYILPARGLSEEKFPFIRNGVLEMTLAEVTAIFEPTVSTIVGLVKDQIAAANIKSKCVKAVLLAGGFGRNAYLERRISEAVESGITVTVMNDSTTAIVQGALIQSLADHFKPAPNVPRPMIVRTRFASSHIGTIAYEEYDPEVHGVERQREPGGSDGGERVEVMQWLLDKNTPIRDDEGIDFPFEFDQSVDQVISNGNEIDSMELEILYCEEDDRPKYPERNGRCKPLVKLPADFNRIPRESLMKHVGLDGRMWYKIPFIIVRTCRLANVHFDFVYLQPRPDGPPIRVKYDSVKAESR